MKKILILSLLGICFSSESVLCAVGLSGVWGSRHKEVTADETALYLLSLNEEATNRALKDIKEKCQNLRAICILDCTINEDSAEDFSEIVRNNSRLQIVNFSRSKATTPTAQESVVKAILLRTTAFNSPICVSLPEYDGRAFNTEIRDVSNKVLELQNENCKSSHLYHNFKEHKRIATQIRDLEAARKDAQKEYTNLYNRFDPKTQKSLQTAHALGATIEILSLKKNELTARLEEIEKQENSGDLSRLLGIDKQLREASNALHKKLGQSCFTAGDKTPSNRQQPAPLFGKEAPVPSSSSSSSSDADDSTKPLLNKSNSRSKGGDLTYEMSPLASEGFTDDDDSSDGKEEKHSRSKSSSSSASGSSQETTHLLRGK